MAAITMYYVLGDSNYSNLFPRGSGDYKSEFKV